MLDQIIADRKARALEYEEYLRQIAQLVEQVEAGHADDTPDRLDTPGKRALYNNLDENEEAALKVDKAVRAARLDDWRGVQAREQMIKRALFEALGDADQVERIFPIIKAQSEY